MFRRVRIIIPRHTVQTIRKWRFALVCLLFLTPLAAYAQSSSPFDSGFTALQNLFTGTIAKVASLIAIVIGGYGFAHGEPGAKRLDHGYAVTSHSSQGLTAERVLVNIDTNVHPRLINDRFAYVSVSRASHDAQIYTNDAAALVPGLSHDVSKTSAVVIGRAHDVSPGMEQGVGKQQANDIAEGFAL